MLNLAILTTIVFLLIPTAIAWGVTSTTLGSETVDLAVLASTIKFLLTLFMTVTIGLLGAINGLAVFIFLSTTRRMEKNITVLFSEIKDIQENKMSFDAHDRICGQGYGRKNVR